jgi:hypothetical protein
MATTYRSTITVNVWKQHTCVHCGGTFRYLFKRKKTGQGASPDAASANARTAVVHALAHEVDMQPCPGCGLYQPDMVGSERSRRHWYLFWASLVLLALPLLLGATDLLSFSTTSLIGGGVCAALLLGHVLVDLRNPNRNLDANQRLAQERVERGDLWVPPDSRPQPAEADAGFAADTGRSPAHLVAYVLLGLGMLSFLLPELLRSARGWVENPGWYPAVAGPGDEVYTYFPDRISSVKGYWNAQANAQVVNANEAGLASPQLRVTSKTDSWGNSISVKSSEKNSSSRLWASVLLPRDPNLAGQTLRIKIDMMVTYPAMQGNGFENVQSSFNYTANLRLSAPQSGSQYRACWWGGMLTGLVLALLSGLLLAKLADSFKKRALPTNIFEPRQDEDEDDGRGRQRQAEDDRDDDRPRSGEPGREPDDRFRD